jgi:hypothetical protein
VTGKVEIVVAADGGVFLEGGGGWQGLQVRYRSVGARRWAKFIVIGAPGQSLLDLLGAAIVVVSLADAAGIRGTRADREQLQLEGAAA